MPQGLGFKLYGDWGKAEKLTGELPIRFAKARKQAVMQEAHYFRAEIVKYLREPGNFLQLSPKTLAMRRFKGFKGQDPLKVRGDMRNSVNVTQTGDGAFVGILKTAKNKDGKLLYNLAMLHEFGSKSIVVHVTAKSSRFYHAAMARGGISLPGGHGHGGGYPIVIIRIPARPFFGPIFKKIGDPNEVRARMYQRLNALLWNTTK